MAQAPKPPISQKYPTGLPVARLVGRTYPPIAVPSAGAFARSKVNLPKLPAAIQLFHKPRNPGHG